MGKQLENNRRANSIDYLEFFEFAARKGVPFIPFNSYEVGVSDERPYGDLPVFNNSISRRVGPMPKFPFHMGEWDELKSEVLDVTGEVHQTYAGFGWVFAKKYRVEKGWGRWIPEGLDVKKDKNKLWLLGRSEFSPEMSSPERDDADDPWFCGLTFVPRGQTDAWRQYCWGQEDLRKEQLCYRCHQKTYQQKTYKEEE